MKKVLTLFPFICAALISILLAVVIYNFKVSSQINLGSVIVHELEHVHTILNQIDHQCRIISFDFQKNHINFLTIKKDGFVGSEVGSMNLAYPQNWNGPYVKNNPTIQGKEFLVVNTYDGYFITPGLGVKLPDGSIIGKDVALGPDSDIQSMIRYGGALNFEGNPLAIRLEIGRGADFEESRIGIPFPKPGA